MLRSACLAKKVLVKPVQVPDRPVGGVGPPRGEFERVRRLAARLRAPVLVEVLAAGGVGVVLGQRAVADDEELDVLEQARARPEAVALVAVDLVECLADVHPRRLSSMCTSGRPLTSTVTS